MVVLSFGRVVREGVRIQTPGLGKLRQRVVRQAVGRPPHLRRRMWLLMRQGACAVGKFGRGVDRFGALQVLHRVDVGRRTSHRAIFLGADSLGRRGQVARKGSDSFGHARRRRALRAEGGRRVANLSIGYVPGVPRIRCRRRPFPVRIGRGRIRARARARCRHRPRRPDRAAVLCETYPLTGGPPVLGPVTQPLAVAACAAALVLACVVHGGHALPCKLLQSLPPLSF